MPRPQPVPSVPRKSRRAARGLNARLLQAARDLAFARDLDSVMAIVGTTAREATGADGVTFVLREGSFCHYADEAAIAPLWKGRRFPLDQCISGWVMRRGVPVAIADVFSDPRVPHDAYRETFVKSLAMVPVRTPDPVAAIGAYWAGVHQATPRELEALQTIADSAALALANIQLYQELRTSLEQQQQARATAEAATEAKDNFLAIVAHELRQPLAACTAALSLLRLQPSGAARGRAHGVMERQVVRMTRLVEDLLDAARVVRGDVVLNRHLVDLRDVVRQAMETARPSIDARAHLLRVHLPETSCLVEGDSPRLEQVLVNLLHNAAQYTPERGVIDVRLDVSGPQPSVSVRDNGEGIEADKLSAIFELFTRNSKASQSGFGIGLAVARRLVERHGGQLVARSEGPGSGSEFILTLPASANRSGENDRGANPGYRQAGAR